MDFNIRPININDAADINNIRIMDGVRENILGITSERIALSQDFISNMGPNHHQYVAEIEEDGKKIVVGTCGLSVSLSQRLRHSGSIGIMVHKDFQGQGIGRKLLEEVIDLADNWLMLVRLELTVFTDNEKAMNLYKSLGFELEGTKKYAVIRNGKYDDEYIMGRYNKRLVVG